MALPAVVEDLRLRFNAAGGATSAICAIGPCRRRMMVAHSATPASRPGANYIIDRLDPAGMMHPVHIHP
jgi:hypothetical protein